MGDGINTEDSNGVNGVGGEDFVEEGVVMGDEVMAWERVVGT